MNTHQKGVAFLLSDTILIAFQPIIAKARPDALDPFFFASVTVLLEGLILLPALVATTRAPATKETFTITMRTHWKRLVGVGAIFGFALILFYIATKVSGPVTTAIVLKVDAVFTVFSGYFILKEKITRKQVFFALLAFLGIYIAITQGKPLHFTIYDTILFLIPTMWLLGHTLAKPLLESGRITPVQLTCVRTLISATILIPLYYGLYGSFPWHYLWENAAVVIFIMVGTYVGGHLLWYASLQRIELSTANQLGIVTPLLTAVFSFLILREPVTIYHGVGIVIVTLSLLVILREKSRQFGTTGSTSPSYMPDVLDHNDSRK